MLYAGNQTVIFYGSNAWSYIRLGHVLETSAQVHLELLSEPETAINLSLCSCPSHRT